MTSRVFLFWLAGAVCAQGFVPVYDGQRRALHWDFSPGNGAETNIINPSTHALRYFISASAYSTANRTAELDAIRAAFGQWQSVPGTSIKFEEGGLIDGAVDVNTKDGTNVIFWAKQSTLVFGGTADITGVTGFTFYDYFSDGTLAEADIVLNGVNFTWFTDFNNPVAGSQFVEGAALHEIGHFIGLDHSPVGGATMLARGLGGLNTQAGLSADEVAAARAMYPKAGLLAGLGGVSGRVRANGAAVFGAVVIAEDMAGNVISGTVTGPDGSYTMPALAPANYFLRVTPLDPANGGFILLTGSDIASQYAGANTAFIPTHNQLGTVNAGVTNRLDVAVTAGNPAFRIYRLGRPGPFRDTLTVVNAGVAIAPGSDNLYIAVYSPDLPTSNAALSVTGDGVTVGAPYFLPSAVAGMNLMSAPIKVAANATPGLRSLVVQRGDQIAYANGFLEISPTVPDFNFDGLDDRWQRRYFPVFTAPEAAPEADPDGDGFSNLCEFQAGTDPTDPNSFPYRILGLRFIRTGTLITAQTGLGRAYQLLSRPSLSDPWQGVGNVFTATSPTNQVIDPAPRGRSRFYQLEQIPSRNRTP